MFSYITNELKQKVMQVKYRTHSSLRQLWAHSSLRQLWPIKLTFLKTKAETKIGILYVFGSPTLLKIGLPWDLCVAAGGTVTRTCDWKQREE